MAGKLVELKDAARVLGVTPEELNEMRSRGEIHGYRDGATWKFKQDEVERVAAERGIEMTGGLGSDGGSGFTSSSDLRVRDGMSDEEFESVLKLGDLEEASDEDLEGASILVTEQGGPMAESTSSTIIGKASQPDIAADSDIRLATEDAKGGSGIDSDVTLTPTPDGSGIQLVSPSSDLEMSAGSDVMSRVTPTPGAVTESDILHSPDSSGKQPSPGSTGKLLVGGGAESDLILESDLSLDEDPLSGPLGGSELALGEEVKLGESGLEEGSGVLGGSLGASDSGINLSKPGDSGLSLEEPLELGGSAVESSLELPEDEDSADVIALEDMGAGPGDATQLKADDEFLLTPVEEAYYDDADSGSQVIALEDSAAITDQNAETMLRPTAQPALLVEPAGAPAQVDLFGGANQAVLAEPVGAVAAQPAWAPAAAVPEAPYSAWNVLMLTFMLGFLFVAGMLTFDLMRNMWAWDKAYGVNTAIMDAIISAVGLNN